MVVNKEKIHYLLDSNIDLSTDDISQLEQIIKKYPWFQSARAVYLKALHAANSSEYNTELQKVASHTTDRSVLFDYITSIEFKQNRISKQINEQREYLENITVEIDSTAVTEENLNKDIDHNKVLDQDLFKQKPLEFKKEDNYSFSEWLKLTTLTPIDRDKHQLEPIEQPKEKASNNSSKIIDEFLEKKPKLTPKKSLSPLHNIADEQTPPAQLMTQTLAQVYAAQGNYEKAIQAYKILKLQHPEKSGFFADRIREIKNLQSNK
jgi:tetratricopeptide (TPR) repeat protein